MALSAIKSKALWCCANAVGPARRRGWGRRRWWHGPVDWLLECIVWNRTLPCFRHWGLLPNWGEDWLMNWGYRGSWDLTWRLFLGL
jgi:hypothetical protein